MDERKILTTKDLRLINNEEARPVQEEPVHKYEPVKIQDIAPIEEEPTALDEFSKKINDKLENAVESVKNKVIENNKQFALETYGDAEALEKESNDDDIELEDVSIVDVNEVSNKEEVEEENISFDNFKDEMNEDDDDDVEETLSTEENKEDRKSVV